MSNQAQGSSPVHQGSIGRSIGAVLTGIIVGAVVTTITDVALHLAGVYPPLGQPVGDGSLALATAYRLVYSVAASYLIAWLAPNRPMLHGLIGGAAGVVACTVGAIVTWNKGPAFGAHWYPVALIVTALPCAWLGAAVRVRQLREVLPA
jgi:hypothetical protein